MSADSLLIDAEFLALERAGVAANVLSEAQQARAIIETHLDAWDKAAAAIRGNGWLSEEGRQGSLGKSAADTASAIESAMKPVLKRLDVAIASLEQQLSTDEPSGENEVVRYLRLKEVRDALRAELGKDPLRWRETYHSALLEGKDTVAVAIENSPIPLLDLQDAESAKLLSKGPRVRAERRSPQEAQQLRSLQAARAAIESAMRTAKSHMGLTGEDWLAKVSREGLPETA